MALDWEFIRSVESKEPTDAQAEVLYDQLIQVSAGDIKLNSLIESTGKVNQHFPTISRTPNSTM